MKKRIKALAVALMMILATFLPIFQNAMVVKADELVIKLHYNRPDGMYDGWDVWFWEVGGEGNSYAFAEENGEMVSSFVVTPGVNEVGFIVRMQDWTKDVGKDQFIDVSAMISGTVHIYVESGVEGYRIEYGEDAKKGTKIISARYSEGVITVATSGAIAEDALASAFAVKGPNGDVAIKEVTATNELEYLITLEKELDLTLSYKISFEGNEYRVVLPNLYSMEDFEAENTYTGDDLGATWTKDETKFRVWAPTAQSVKLNLYTSGTEGTDDLMEQIDMTADVNGTWVASKAGDLNGVYYTYTVNINGNEAEACDPYARTTGVNGKRAMVIDLDSTDPEGWDKDTNPNADLTINDAIIYELHVRDLGTDASSGIANVGKYTSLMEHGTKTAGGMATGVDHIKELGITHLHLLPVYDYGSVDESRLDEPQFNWGYDPVNYNVPEGSYSTDPYNGEVRVKEFKQMVQSLHNDGISVVMDVVYNHVYSADSFCFNKIVPQYFSRVDENGAYSSGSGCGNDTASERSMVKKYIVDSVKYWADEYHINGFRFDLVGLIDTETMNAVVEEVHKTHPDVIFYGEGWTMDTNVTKEGYTMTTQAASEKVPGFAFFSDTIRDAMKGNVFNDGESGYISGSTDKESVIAQCWMGLASPWCKTPAQCVNYASCHDNLTLFDRLQTSRPDASNEDLIKMNNLAAAIYMTAEGIPFMQAGEEMLRTKVKEDGTFDSNSYSSSDAINSLKWSDLDDETYKAVFEYYKGLINFRKAHPALRLTTQEDIRANVKKIIGLPKNVVAMQVTGTENDPASMIYVIFNANADSVELELPEGEWDVCINGEKAGTEKIETVSGKVNVSPISAMVLTQKNPNFKEAGSTPGALPFVLGGIAVLVVIAGVVLVIRRKKK